MTRATHALFFEAPTSNNHNYNNKLLNFLKKIFFCILKMWIITLKIQNDLFFFSQKKTFLQIGMKNGASYQTTTLKARKIEIIYCDYWLSVSHHSDY